jgi:allantoicase
MADKGNTDHPFRLWVDLAQPRLGTQVVYASDDFFADKARMIEPQAPVFIADKYDDHGKWMDGWETRRKRGLGHDNAIVRLGVPGIVKGFDIDTSHFTGNYAPSASIDACVSNQEIPGEDADWEEILPSVLLAGDSHHLFPVADGGPYTHLRLNIYPDGGVARLRVYGMVVQDLEALRSQESVDLVALEIGGRALVCNDEHFGSMHNLIAPGRGVNMGDGWETRRRREPGNDWVILALGHPGRVDRILIDTAYFKGNFPDGASVQAAYVSGGSVDAIATQSLFWETLLPEVKLQMDQEHEYRSEVRDLGPITHVRLNVFPDGGVSRIRLFGRLEADHR